MVCLTAKHNDLLCEYRNGGWSSRLLHQEYVCVEVVTAELAAEDNYGSFNDIPAFTPKATKTVKLLLSLTKIAFKISVITHVALVHFTHVALTAHDITAEMRHSQFA